MQSVLAEKGFMKIDIVDGGRRVVVKIDSERIMSHGRKAVGELLLRLHIYRCTADVENGGAWYEELTSVDEYWQSIREIVLQNKPSRVHLVQANTFLVDSKVVLKQYEPTVDGLIQSWVERGL